MWLSPSPLLPRRDLPETAYSDGRWTTQTSSLSPSDADQHIKVWKPLMYGRAWLSNIEPDNIFEICQYVVWRNLWNLLSAIRMPALASSGKHPGPVDMSFKSPQIDVHRKPGPWWVSHCLVRSLYNVGIAQKRELFYLVYCSWESTLKKDTPKLRNKKIKTSQPHTF